MKKLVSLTIVVLMLTCSCFIPVLASQTGENGYVIDNAGILNSLEKGKLEGKAKTASETYQCGVYIMTVDDYKMYGGSSLHNITKGIYQKYQLGYGEETDGILLLLSMKERDYILFADGFANTAFTDYGKDWLAEQFLAEFQVNDWNGGFEEYLDRSSELLKQARDGKPFDINTAPTVKMIGFLFSALLSLIIAAITGSVLKGQMNSVAEKCEAGEYIAERGVSITHRRDMFIKRTTYRTKIEKKSGKSSGGTTTDSDGYSSKSGKF